jgi:Protein of unknown function (DUF3224)
MTTHGMGSFEITSWNEDRYEEYEDTRGLAQADVTQTFTGDIEGTGSVRWLMCYRPDGTADWVGLQRVDGRIGRSSGSFVLQTIGTFDGTRAAGDWSVVPDSATGQLQGLTGRGRIEAPMGSKATFTLDYDL